MNSAVVAMDLNLSKRTRKRLELLSEKSPEKWQISNLRDVCRLTEKSINEIRREMQKKGLELKN